MTTRVANGLTKRSFAWLAAISLCAALLAPDVARAASSDWVQIGDRIDGQGLPSPFGHRVSIDAAGQTIAVGTPSDTTGGSQAGLVRVLRNDGGEWVQVGRGLEGTSESRFGFSVALSGDATTVVAGGPYAAGVNGDDVGRVEVHRFDGADWVQVGLPLEGDVSGDWLGRSVAISSDGKTIAAGAMKADAATGRVKIFREVDGDWQQVGDDIVGEAVDDGSGVGLALSGDGATVAIGAPENDGNGFDSGHVRVYRFDDATWTQLGGDIDGENDRDWLGFDVDISDDGNTVVAGAPWNDAVGPQTGHARVFQLVDGLWQQKGSDIDGLDANDYQGWAVAISADGDTVVTSRPRHDRFRNNAGQVSVVTFDGADWVAVGTAIDGERAGDVLGRSVAISEDASTLVAAAAERDPAMGYAKVYELSDDDPVEPAGDGDVVFLVNEASGRYLDGDGVHRFWNADTSPDGLFDARWQVVDHGDGTWSLLNKRRTRYLDADGPKSGWAVRQSVLISLDDMWEVTPSDDGSVTLRNIAFDRYLHETDDHDVRLVGEDGLDQSSKWRIVPVG